MVLAGFDFAEALEAAHEQGIIHRDLKPANIKVRRDGTVKVLDFGLAKAMDAVGDAQSATGRASVSQSPTITTPAMTHAGMILGTAAYMSPEQASGRPVDKRADIWSFGVVLFEMLSGQRLFGGETVAHTIADVLRAPIDVGELPKDAPRGPASFKRCFRDVEPIACPIGEARLTIDRYLADPASVEVPDGVRSARQWGAWAAAAILAVLAIVGWLRPRPEASQSHARPGVYDRARGRCLARVGDIHATPAISPDGTAVIFYRGDAAAGFGSGDGMRLRRLNQLSPEPVRTGRFTNPGFWSPDSRSFVFTDGTTLKKMRVPDGAPEIVVSDVPALVGGSWSESVRRDGRQHSLAFTAVSLFLQPPAST